MVRALVTMVAASLFILIVAPPLLLLGIIRPVPRLADHAAWLWARMILALAGTRMKISGMRHIEDGRPRVFMGNHQSALDIPILLVALRGRVRMMGKKSLFQIPRFGRVAQRYGHIPIDRESPRRAWTNLSEMVGRVKREPVALAVFPEGTRSHDGRISPFRQGTMKIAQRTGLPIAPFAIDGAVRINPPTRFALVPGDVHLTFLPPIPSDEVSAMSGGQLRDHLMNIVEDCHRSMSAPDSPDVTVPVAEGA